MEKGKKFTKSEIAQFTGTENWYSHSIARNVHYTDGMLFVAERAGAYWLIDEIAVAQKGEPALAGEEFQAWLLVVEGTKARRRCYAARTAMEGGCWRSGSTTPTSRSLASSSFAPIA